MSMSELRAIIPSAQHGTSKWYTKGVAELQQADRDSLQLLC